MAISEESGQAKKMERTACQDQPWTRRARLLTFGAFSSTTVLEDELLEWEGDIAG
jgi:hypothetical protein